MTNTPTNHPITRATPNRQRKSLVRRLRSFMLIGLFGFSVSLWHCGPECAPTKSQDCTCNTGAKGRQVCDSAIGKWSACVCPQQWPDGGIDGGTQDEATAEAPADKKAPTPDRATPPPPPKTPEVCSPRCQNQGVCENKICQCPQNFTGSTCDKCKDGFENYPQCTPKNATADFPIYLKGLPSDLYVHEKQLYWFLHQQNSYELYQKPLTQKGAHKAIFQRQNPTPVFTTLSHENTQHHVCESEFTSKQPSTRCYQVPKNGDPAVEYFKNKSAVYMTSWHEGSLFLYGSPASTGAPTPDELTVYDAKTKKSQTYPLPECPSPSQMFHYKDQLILHCFGVYHTHVENDIQTESWRKGVLFGAAYNGELKELHVKDGEGILSALLIDDTIFYGTGYWRTAPQGALRSINLKTKAKKTFHTGLGDIMLLKTDGASLYWIETQPFPGLNILPTRQFTAPFSPARRFYIRSMPKGGGPLKTLVNSVHPIVGLTIFEDKDNGEWYLYYATYQDGQKQTVIWQKKL